jgi:hypothetical protein
MGILRVAHDSGGGFALVVSFRRATSGLSERLSEKAFFCPNLAGTRPASLYARRFRQLGTGRFGRSSSKKFSRSLQVSKTAGPSRSGTRRGCLLGDFKHHWRSTLRALWTKRPDAP